MTEPEIALMKKQIEVQLDEYAEAIKAYETWMAAWRARQPRGFRAKRRKPMEQAAFAAWMEDHVADVVVPTIPQAAGAVEKLAAVVTG